MAVKRNIDVVNMEGVASEGEQGAERGRCGEGAARRMRKPRRPETYHHGSLKEALLLAAERILSAKASRG